jgi:hypothetical protein
LIQVMYFERHRTELSLRLLNLCRQRFQRAILVTVGATPCLYSAVMVTSSLGSSLKLTSFPSSSYTTLAAAAEQHASLMELRIELFVTGFLGSITLKLLRHQHGASLGLFRRVTELYTNAIQF